MATQTVEGIRNITQHAAANAGELALPVEFDSNKFAAKWSKKGTGVEKARQPQNLGNGTAADGWQVWKSKRGQTCQKVLSSGVYVLMCRPKALQKAVNAAFGNVSRKRVLNEHEGHTVEGEATQTGMLSDHLLRGVPGLQEGQEKLPLPLNEMPSPDFAHAARAATKVKPKLKL